MPRQVNLPASGRSRLLLLAACTMVVLAVAAGIAVLLARGSGHHDAASPNPTHTAVPAPSPTASEPTAPGAAPTGSARIPGPPSTTDPVAFARAAAAVLWSYDTRTETRAAHLAVLERWMTGDRAVADPASVDDVVPDVPLWPRLAAERQHATATVAEAHIPSAFRQAMAADPQAITRTYTYAVTATGTQHLAWTGGSGAQGQAITLAVQCRPGTPCRLAGIAPVTAP
ncbi:hypothetical protein BIV57_19155 [Mangrovactinospora gilvigrisea]|uniref:Uncharacterized protein n=1 Tax=Mangrovactinospora gilvigrisea TaxID=1428644 RepID=A0A1J7C2Q0_9ACTN|nr:hypothetical protein [Mangrovactinospora gilvigrisea]OIV35840.1 hypothetical protein BIV57_19155 [Mangrovactinospora gilvigrisea]